MTLHTPRILFFFFCFVAFGQLTAQNSEQLHVHFDKPFYVTGEDSWFKIYFKNELATIQSKVVRVEWTAPNGQLLLQQKLKVEGNIALGDLTIPYDWKEGNYLFRAYTLWNLNFGEASYFEQVIPIFNLLETPKSLAPTADTNRTEISALAKNTLQILATTNQSSYQSGDSVQINIQVKDKTGNPISAHISLSVTDGNYLPAISEEQLTTSSINLVSNPTFANQYKAETGIILNGQLKDLAGNPLDTRFLTLYFPNTQSFESSSITAGLLDLPIKEFEGSQVVQFFDMNPFHDPIPIIRIEKFFLKKPSTSKPLYRSEMVANYLLLLSQYRQYREVFNLPAPAYKVAPTVQKAILDPDKSWTMEKYTGLSDIASFVSEIITSGRVISKGNTRSIRLQYANKGIFNRLSPWFLVNGWLTEDEVTVLKMPFRAIEKIELFNSKQSIATQLDPSMVSRGLLSIFTKDGKTPEGIIKKPNNLEIEGFYPIRPFPVMGTRGKNAPDFRPVIYWQPNIQTNSNGQASVRFATSDAIGKCHISIVGVSKNGEIGMNTIAYEVGFE